MGTPDSAAPVSGGSPAGGGRREPLVNHRSTAFIVAGLLVLASLLAPVGFGLVADRPWRFALGFVGLGVIALALGHLGLYPDVKETAPVLARVGAVSTAIAGGAAAVLVGMSGAAIVSSGGGAVPIVPKPGFMAIGIAMALGAGLGFLTFGVAGRTAAAIGRTVPVLLGIAGAVLIVPVGGELLGRTIGIGTPSWLVGPVVVTMALATVGAGIALRRSDMAGSAA